MHLIKARTPSILDTEWYLVFGNLIIHLNLEYILANHIFRSYEKCLHDFSMHNILLVHGKNISKEPTLE